MDLKELEAQWKQETRENVKAFIAEMGNEGKCIRLEAMYEQLWDAENELEDKCKRYKKALEHDRTFTELDIISMPIQDIEKRISTLKMRIRMILAEAEGKVRKDQITPEMILTAKNHPIEDLLPPRYKGNYLCIYHTERNPSMSIKNNKVTCFSCGYHGDSIDVYMHINGTSFHEAVRRLQ